MPSKLLIADDNTTFQKVFERTFPARDFAITFVNNGKEGLAKAREDKPDLIIADINMPLKNGFEVCEEVKNDPQLKGTPVLLLVGILDDFDENESRRVGADGFITKPFEANAAISKVREILTLREGLTPLEKGVEEIPRLKGAMEEAVEDAGKEVVPREEAIEEGIPRGEAVKEEEQVLELDEVVEEPVAATPAPIEGKEEEIGLESLQRELEAELKKELPGEKMVEKEESFTLDLPLDEMEPEPVTSGAEAPGLFEELGVGEGKGEAMAGKPEVIPNESAAELEGIQGLAPETDERKGETVEEFGETLIDTFEPVLDANGEDYKRIDTFEKDLQGVSKEALEGLAERLAAVLSQELRKAVEEVIVEKLPKLLRQEVERVRSE